MVFHWSLTDSKSPLISWPLLRIIPNLNNAGVWMVSTRSFIFKSSSLCINPLVTTSSVKITVTFIFYSFLRSLAKSRYYYYNYYYYLIFYEFFTIALADWWFLTRVWVTTSFLKDPGLFSVFCPMSVMQQFRWSPLVLLFPNLPVLEPILWWLYQEHQLL